MRHSTCACLPTLQVRGELSADARRKVNTLIITDVHARDIIDQFVRDSIMDAHEFAWESQLRFYWDQAAVRVEGAGGAVLLLTGVDMHASSQHTPLPVECRMASPSVSCARPSAHHCVHNRTTWSSGSARARSCTAMSTWASTAASSSRR